jgi:signal transduction histidine kinase
MEFRSLKMAIFFNLFCLLVLAMALIAVAMAGVSGNRLARQEKNALTMLVRLQAENMAGDRDRRLPQLRALCQTAGDACLRVVLRDGAGETLAVEGAAKTGSLPSDRLARIEEPIPGEKGSLLLTVQFTAPFADFRRDLSLVLALIAANALIFAAIGFFRLAQKIVRPLERLTAAAGRHAGELDTLFRHGQGDELRRLSLALHGLFARIELDNEQIRAAMAHLEKARDELAVSQKEMIRAEKMASIGRLAAGLAHEIGNPLGIIEGYLTLLRQDGLPPEDRADFAGRAGAEVRRVSGLLRNLLDFARPARSGGQQADLAACLGQLLPMLRAQKESRGISLTVEGEIPSARLSIGGEALHQVLLNCLLNAIDAIAAQGYGRAGQITIHCQTLAESSEEAQLRLAISIADNGGGIEEKHLEMLFDPFFTTKEPGKGTGLGLAISHSLIEAAGGGMRLRNNEMGGATMTIELPLMKENTLKRDDEKHPGR